MALDQFLATCVQTTTKIVTDAATKDAVIAENLERCLELIDYICAEPRYYSKLVVFPEFFLTSPPESRTIEDYLMRSIEIPGPVTEAIGRKARQYGIYVVGNSFEIDPDWPGRVFNTSYIIGPTGEVILKYRKLNDVQAYIPTSTNPGDVYTEYVERYGYDALFPVVDTEIGRLACMTCYDINFPEVARCLALKGAEILCMCTGEGYSFSRKFHLLRQARAYENACYIVMANHGRFIGPRPEFQQRGYASIIDPRGEIVEQADGPGECTVTGLIDLEGLRKQRSRVDFFNFLVGLRASLYAPVYQNAPCWPLDGWKDHPIQRNAEAVEMGERVRNGLYERGILVPPEKLRHLAKETVPTNS